ncbi:hypothetical protein Q5752_000273 [Cryptotrichosporon argae]
MAGRTHNPPPALASAAPLALPALSAPPSPPAVTGYVPVKTRYIDGPRARLYEIGRKDRPDLCLDWALGRTCKKAGCRDTATTRHRCPICVGDHMAFQCRYFHFWQAVGHRCKSA